MQYLEGETNLYISISVSHKRAKINVNTSVLCIAY